MPTASMTPIIIRDAGIKYRYHLDALRPIFTGIVWVIFLLKVFCGTT